MTPPPPLPPPHPTSPMPSHVVVFGMSGYNRPIDEYLDPLARRGARVTWITGGTPGPGVRALAADVLDLSKFADDEALFAAVDRLHAEHPVNAVVSFGEDCILRAAALSARYGLDLNGHDAAVRTTDKWEMRRALAEHGVPVPRFARVCTRAEYDRAAAEAGLPFVVKPVQSSGSRGVKVVRTAAEAEACYDWAVGVSVADSGRAELLVEEFVDGPEYSAEIVVQNGRIVFLSFTEKYLIDGDYRDEVGHLHPFHFEPSLAEEIGRTLQGAVTAAGVRQGGCHLEFKLNGRALHVIEIASRLGGAGIPLLVRISTGVDLVDLVYAACLGEPIRIPPLRRMYAGVRFVTFVRPGTVATTALSRDVFAVPGLVQAGLYVEAGSAHEPSSSGGARVGFVLARHRDRPSLLGNLREALRRVHREVLDEHSAGSVVPA